MEGLWSPGGEQHEIKHYDGESDGNGHGIIDFSEDSENGEDSSAPAK